MRVSELIELCEFKPQEMPCCEGCQEKVCLPNPIECQDFCIHNMFTIMGAMAEERCTEENGGC